VQTKYLHLQISFNLTEFRHPNKTHFFKTGNQQTHCMVLSYYIQSPSFPYFGKDSHVLAFQTVAWKKSLEKKNLLGQTTEGFASASSMTRFDGLHVI